MHFNIKSIIKTIYIYKCNYERIVKFVKLLRNL